MTRLFLSIYDFLSRRRGWGVVILLLLTGILVLLALNMHYEEDIAKFLPNNTKNEKYQEVYRQIAQPNRIAIIFSAKDTLRGVPADRMEEAMEDMGERLQNRTEIKNLMISVDEEQSMEMLLFVCRNIPYFLTPADYNHIDSLLAQPEYIKQQLEYNKKILMLPMASTAMETMEYDPLHLFTPVLKRLKTFKINSKFTTVDGYLFTEDGKHALITFNSSYGSSETHRNAELAQMLDTLMSQTQKKYSDIRISAVGAPLIAVTNAQQIKSDALLAMSIAVVLILGLLFLHYRRLSDILWIAVPVVFGWLFAVGGMRIFTDSISIIVLGIGSVIIGICVNYPLHYLDHSLKVACSSQDVQRSTLKDMIAPLFIGNITTVAAFLCLIWLDARAMHDLGLFGSLMLIGTILFVLIFLPLYVKARPVNKQQLDIRLDFLKLRTRKQRHIFMWTVVFITLVLGWFSFKTSFDSNLSHINYMTPDQREDMNMLSSTVNQQPVYVVAEGNTLEKALERNDDMTKHFSGSDFNGIGYFLKSQKRQKENLHRWNLFWKNRRSSLINALASESKVQGYAMNAFMPFMEMLQTTPSLQPISYFAPILHIAGSHYIQKDKGKVKIVNIVNTKNPQALEKSINNPNVYQHNNGHQFAFSANDISNQLVNILNGSFNYIGIVCSFVVFFFLWVSFGRIELSLLSFLPLAVSWLWILGMMEVLHIQFNIVNIILATFIFGQGDDYTIFITEGLTYEYAYGRPRLASYKRSVALSAILMFIGIGTLILAKHPALQSLASVTIIGMFTVVFMAFYLSPIVFHWMTTKKEQIREVPLTLRRLAYSIGSMLFFVSVMFLLMLPFTWIYFHVGKCTEARKLRYHNLLNWMAKFIITKIPGVKFTMNNPHGETFDTPAVIICNHQSHLDTVCLMLLHPKMVFLTNQWAWNTPFYSSVIHHAEYLPAAESMGEHIDALKDLYRRGYSICIFPEGTRSLDYDILRFHKGAFYLAEQLEADIIPVILHGTGYVLPKKELMLRSGTIHAEIMPRLKVGSVIMGEGYPQMGLTYRERTRAFHHLYIDKYQAMKEQFENAHYCAQLVRYQYLYKGSEIERRCLRNLKTNNCYAAIVDEKSARGLEERTFENAGQGELPYIYALVHPETQVTAIVEDEDDYALMTHMAHLPRNLKVIRKNP